MKRAVLTLTLFTLLATGVALHAGDPCVSGLKPGLRPGPYASVACTGQDRGDLHCYICETENRPAVVVFARSLDEPLGKLASKLDRAVHENQKAEMRGWITFLGESQAAMDKDVVAWGKKHALTNMPLTVFEDLDGPPTYLLSRDADVTVLCFVNQKVVANFAYRKGELNDAEAEKILKVVPELILTKQ